MEEFRAVYAAQMKAKYTAAMQLRQAQQPPAPLNRPLEDHQGAALQEDPPANLDDHHEGLAAPHQQADGGRFQWLDGALPALINVVIVCLVITHGDMSNFFFYFSIFGGLKLAYALMSKVRIQWHRKPEVPQQQNADGHHVNAKRGVRGRGRMYFVAYVTFRAVTTFFVSMFPSFRVEALEKELRDDGITYDEAERQQAREEALRQQQQHPPVAAADGAQ